MEKKYQINIAFKNNKQLYFDIVQEDDLRENFIHEWTTSKKEGILIIGDYIISIDDILWIRIEGERISEKSSGN